MNDLEQRLIDAGWMKQPDTSWTHERHGLFSRVKGRWWLHRNGKASPLATMLRQAIPALLAIQQRVEAEPQRGRVIVK